jgi:pimeloyl-ACP methyl ester carboxylesterase
MAALSPDVDYADRGSGPALLFVPGSFGTSAGWRAVIDNIGDGYRIVSTSLLGYGATAERRPSHNPTMAEQVGVLDAKGGRHFLPATHAAALAHLIVAHVASVSGPP